AGGGIGRGEGAQSGWVEHGELLNMNHRPERTASLPSVLVAQYYISTNSSNLQLHGSCNDSCDGKGPRQDERTTLHSLPAQVSRSRRGVACEAATDSAVGRRHPQARRDWA